MALPTLNAAKCIGKPVTIYGLCDPRDNTLFYIGATTQALCNRLGGHVADARARLMAGRHYDIIRGIFDVGLRVEIFAIETVSAAEWPEAEQFWIAYFRFVGANLTNKGIGGPGGLGARASLQRKERIRDAMKLGHIKRLHSPAARAKAVASNRRAVELDGVHYDGVAVAARALGVTVPTVVSCLSG